ncbi:MAG: thioesterase family protein [Acidimicrobiales bacterium]|nr:thioesterase family protein [Acidimicrobiales bacterium]
MTYLDDARVTPVDETHYQASLSPAWRSMLDIHGGYVAAIAARAIEMSLDDPTRPLRSYNAQFLRPARAGEITIHIDTVRSGRTAAFVRGTVTQDNRPVLTATAIAGSDKDGLTFTEVPPPAGATNGPPADATRFVGTEPGLHFAQLDLRFEPGLTIFGGHPRARVAGWLRPLDPAEMISLPWMICATDVMPPSMVFRTDRAVQAATIDMAVQLVRSQPSALVPPGTFVYAESICSISAEGYSVEDATFWSPDAQLLATSRQVRLAGTPPPATAS